MNKRRRIAVFAGGGLNHASGGVGTLLLNLLEEWKQRPFRWDVEVTDTRGSGGPVGAAIHFGNAIIRLIWLASTGQVALIHANMTTRGSAVRKSCLVLLGRTFGVPAVMHLHGADFQDFYRRSPVPFQRLIQLAFWCSRHIIVLGENWRAFLVREVGVRPERISIVRNGVPVPARTEPRQPEAGAPVRLLFLGRLGERKGVPELLTALSTQHLKSRCWTATLAGDGPVSHYREQVLRAGLADRVLVPGWVGPEGREKLLRDADVLILPSHHEALPMAVLEALAYRVSVITTPVGVVPELLEDGITARLVQPGDADGLADAVRDLIDAPAERRRLAAAGYRLFLEQLEIGAVAEQISAVYMSAIASHRQRSGDAAKALDHA